MMDAKILDRIKARFVRPEPGPHDYDVLELIAEIERLQKAEMIVRDLMKHSFDPADGCFHCTVKRKPLPEGDEHEINCPWRRAKEYIDGLSKQENQ